MKIDPYVLEAIKGMDLPKLIQGYGIVLKPAGKNAYKALCPFHDEKTPSLSVGFKNNKWIWNCFGACKRHGNALDFRMAYEKISFTDAYQKSAEELKMAPSPVAASASPTPATVSPAPTAPSGIPRQELLARAVEIYHAAFLEDRGGADYMAGRGIKDGELFKQFRVGFVNGRLHRMLPKDPDHEFVRGLKAVGILNDRGTERFHKRVVFPITDENGAVVGLYGRSTRTGWMSSVKHMYLRDRHQGVWNGVAIKAYKDIVLTESIIDAASLITAGIKNAVPLYGTNGLTDEHLRLFREHRTERIFLCLDNDEAGERARRPITEKLEPLGIEVLDFELPKRFKDPNDALMKGFPAEELLVLFRINGVLARAKKLPELFLSDEETFPGPAMVVVPLEGADAPAEKETPPAGEAPPAPAAVPAAVVAPTITPPLPTVSMEAVAPGPSFPGSESPETRPDSNRASQTCAPLAHGAPATAPAVEMTVERREDGIYFTFGRRSYRVTGLPGKRREHLRVSMKVEYAGAVHLDHLDLYSARSRSAFVDDCRRIFEAQEGELNGELNRIINELEKLQGADGEKKDERPPMTEEEKAEALAALKDPALLSNILKDMGMIYVGEGHNKVVGYLVGVSRKMDDPMSCITISQSGAGKSGLVEVVEWMTPPEEVRTYSRMTQYSLYYDTRTGFKHKLLIAEEQGGAEEADYSIRTFMSKKWLKLLVPAKDATTGQIRNEERKVEGPVAYMGTTTRGQINDENATRCFLIFLDESEEQTRRIHERQRQSKTLDGLRAKTVEEAMIHRHHVMQRLLRKIAVVIPYAGLLNFPTTWLRTRRDNLRFLSLIQCITFLHQYQREVKATADGVEYIEATFGDYQTAFDLASHVMGESFQDLKKPQRELLRAIHALVPSGGPRGEGPSSGNGVARRQIREATGLAQRRMRELLDDLVELEYVEPVQGRQGQSYRYRLSDRGLGADAPLQGLTTPEELRRKLAGM